MAEILSVVCFAAWIWFIIDAAKKQRYGWLVAIVLLNLLAIVPWLFVRNQQPKPHSQESPWTQYDRSRH